MWWVLKLLKRQSVELGSFNNPNLLLTGSMTKAEITKTSLQWADAGVFVEAGAV